MSWFGLGKKRSKLGRYLDRHGIAQIEVEKGTKLSRGTISRLCSSDDNKPTFNTANKIVRFLRRFDNNVDYDDFWSM
ncbi:helix-turn-helix domain-containing protein [Bacillus sp. SCS-151]|uniref:helix-turn-helix domain-containing protein n=1 Tax=Nanhaiella sioensis TaxID=3115293 RepID=UPI0039791C5F